MRLRVFSRGVWASLLCLIAGVAMAGEFFEQDGVALRGYDPVSYFEEGKPRQGLASHSHTYKGSTFHFSSPENQRKFAENPQKYAPQFGGFCAYGATKGAKFSTQPDAFAVVDGKLYLNKTRKVQSLWEQDIPGNIALANEKWPEVSKSKQKD